MTLNLSSWGETIGISAVVLSLVFVGYELRQSSTIAAVDAGQQLAQMGQELSIFQSQSDVAAIVLKAESDYASLEPVEKLQFTGLVLITFNLWEHAYYSHTEGVLSDELWAIWHESHCDVLTLPWFKHLRRMARLASYQSSSNYKGIVTMT